MDDQSDARKVADIAAEIASYDLPQWQIDAFIVDEDNKISPTLRGLWPNRERKRNEEYHQSMSGQTVGWGNEHGDNQLMYVTTGTGQKVQVTVKQARELQDAERERKSWPSPWQQVDPAEAWIDAKLEEGRGFVEILTGASTGMRLSGDQARRYLRQYVPPELRLGIGSSESRSSPKSSAFDVQPEGMREAIRRLDDAIGHLHEMTGQAPARIIVDGDHTLAGHCNFRLESLEILVHPDLWKELAEGASPVQEITNGDTFYKGIEIANA